MAAKIQKTHVGMIENKIVHIDGSIYTRSSKCTRNIYMPGSFSVKLNIVKRNQIKNLLNANIAKPHLQRVVVKFGNNTVHSKFVFSMIEFQPRYIELSFFVSYIGFRDIPCGIVKNKR